jgi:hypothetical protein
MKKKCLKLPRYGTSSRVQEDEIYFGVYRKAEEKKDVRDSKIPQQKSD